MRKGFKENLKISQAEIYALQQGDKDSNELVTEIMDKFGISFITARAIVLESRYKRKYGFKKRTNKEFIYKFKGKERSKFVFTFK